MMPLPWDYSRCAPQEIDDKCRNCKRWVDHPKQSCNPHRQSFVVTKNSKDKACIHLSISLLEKK